MGRPSMTQEQINEMKIKLIRTTQDMISEGDISSVSIRNVGSRMGINSATIYRYFRDLDELILFACVAELQEYLLELTETQNSASKSDPVEFYLLSWKLFCKHAFQRPEQFLRLFFSKHSAELHFVIDEYYKLFPKTLVALPFNQYEMLYNSNLVIRNLLILQPAIDRVLSEKHSYQENTSVSASDETIRTINQLTIAFFYSLLSDKMYNKATVNNEEQIERMLNACRYLLDTAR